MSAESNKAQIRAAYDGFLRGDLSAVFSELHENVVWRSHANVPFAGEYRGIAGVQEFFTALDATVEITKFDVHTLLAEHDAVVGLGMIAVTSKETGLSSEGMLVHVFRIAEDGKVLTFDAFEEITAGIWG